MDCLRLLSCFLVILSLLCQFSFELHETFVISVRLNVRRLHLSCEFFQLSEVVLVLTLEAATLSS